MMSEQSDAGLICEMCRDEDVDQVEMLVYQWAIEDREERIFCCGGCADIVEAMCRGEKGGRAWREMVLDAQKKNHRARLATMQRLMMHSKFMAMPKGGPA